MLAIQKTLSNISKEVDNSINITGVRGSASALIAAQIIAGGDHQAICIVPSESQALTLCRDLALFTKKEIFHYPAQEVPPYTPLSPDSQTIANRISTLYNIITCPAPYIVVTSAEACLRKILPGQNITNLAELVISGEETDQEQLARHLIKSGYEQMSLVQNTGEFSVRGGIFDIFPTGSSYPVRLDFFGDLVESIRYFDPISQRSIEEIQELEIIPASDILFPDDQKDDADFKSRVQSYCEKLDWKQDDIEVFTEKILNHQNFPGIEFFLPLLYENLSSLLSYLPADSRAFVFDPLEVSKSVSITWERITANYNESKQVQTMVLPPDSLFVSEKDFFQQLGRTKPVIFREFEKVAPTVSTNEEIAVSQLEPDSISAYLDNACAKDFFIKSTNHKLIKQNIELQRKKEGLLPPLSVYLHDWLAQGHHVNLACRSLKHATNLAEMLANHNLPTRILNSIADDLASADGTIWLYPFSLSEGFDLTEQNFHFVSESELFGEKRLTVGKKNRPARKPTSATRYEELNLGDIVVHNEHGLGIYNGIINIQLNGIPNDFLQIIYKDDDKLYVPVDRINSVSKYNGLADKKPTISKLGGKAWASAKNKVKTAVWEVAQNLLNLYARRKLEKGKIFSPPDPLYHELEESFPYTETEGQLQAINEVIGDLTSDRCMDRLVCGDVGFGKTEVALRAAFKVVGDNCQVAILVPTTVLAEQHAQTFIERFENFPVNVECLNRFKSAAEQKEIVKKVANGQVDIIIGTHRILSKDVSFKNLGLLIIDEEHRFGVTHKEKLKTLSHGIDVLTLTATPIPRTLQMSLLGVRDLSVISSPPSLRQSVKTFVSKYDDLVIKEAVTKELQRGGQVFLVHNRVHSIHEIAGKVQKLVPEARVAVAHGQMPGKILEGIMVNFVKKEVNVLVCTTIIESGLDIPNANTIIINRADRLGLAEIYQLRGRVGRSSEQAFAYLLVPSLEHMSKDAKQRLRALMEYNELGGGFKLALSDLQIRGGGNILGESQSGTIAAVGYDLYLDLLQKTVNDLKRQAENGELLSEEIDIDPEINLTISAYIPDSYIPDPDQRYIAYKRITSVSHYKELYDLKDEFIDRYGKMPQESINLFEIIEIKDELKKLKVTKLEQAPDALVFSFHQTTNVTPEQILSYIKKSKGQVRMTPDSRLVVNVKLGSPEMTFNAVKNTLRAIMEQVI